MSEKVAQLLRMYKQAAPLKDEPEEVEALSGRLLLSNRGWLLLDVPNDLVHGLFAAINEHGVEMPPTKGKAPYRAHISVMTEDEVKKVGENNLVERGKFAAFQLGAVKSVKPRGWPEMERVWFVEVTSPELEAIRKKYGLSPLPFRNQHAFHITFAVKKRPGDGGLRQTTKAAYTLDYLDQLFRISEEVGV